MSKKEKDIKKSKLSGTDLNEVSGGTSKSTGDKYRIETVQCEYGVSPRDWPSCKYGVAPEVESKNGDIVFPV